MQINRKFFLKIIYYIIECKNKFQFILKILILEIKLQFKYHFSNYSRNNQLIFKSRKVSNVEKKFLIK
jgi:hypothetical protein